MIFLLQARPRRAGFGGIGGELRSISRRITSYSTLKCFEM
jgi:hypothetical protein